MIDKLLNAIFPQPCIVCKRRLIGGEKYICLHCMASLPRNTYSLPVADSELAHRLWGVFPVEGAVTAFLYQRDGIMAPIVHRMKYRGNKPLCHYMGRQMALAVADSGIFEGVDVLVPVPLTMERKRERGYNQSLLLCEGISEVTGIGIETGVLHRRFFGGSQTEMTVSERLENVKGAFYADNLERLNGKHVLVVDDVITTGSTVRECVLQIRDVPSIRISVLALAWTRN